MSPTTAALVAVLIGWSWVDVRHRALPPRAFRWGVLALAPWWSMYEGWTFSVSGAVVGFMLAWIAGWGGGDRWCCAVMGVELGIAFVSSVIGLVTVALMLLLLTRGEFVEMRDIPMIPALTAGTCILIFTVKML